MDEPGSEIMRGAPAPKLPQRNDEDEQGSLLNLVERTLPSPDDVEELRTSGDDGLSFLGQEISPPPRSGLDILTMVAVALALILLEVGIVLLLPAGERIIAQLLPARPPLREEIPPVYLFPYLEQQQEEPPAQEQAPLSDMSRRAHGGEGQPDVRPGSRGNTPEPRLEPPPGARSPGAGGAAERAAERAEAERVAAARGAGEGEGEGQQAGRGRGDDDGAGGVLRGTGEDAVRLPKPGTAGSEGQPPVLRGLPGIGTQGGSGAIADRRGGRVDLGPLSFDTQWYDWGPYAAEMLRRIRYNWDIPEIARIGVQGVVRIHFFIERDGRVSGLVIERESSHPPMDFAARDAIQRASPLPPLPADLPGFEREGVTITFYYNVRPPDRD